MTTGALLSLQDSATAATSTGQVLSISDTTTGPGYGVYSAMTGQGNTGYAGYFANSSTSGANYALYAVTSGGSGSRAVFAYDAGGPSGFGVYGKTDGPLGEAVFGLADATTGFATAVGGEVDGAGVVKGGAFVATSTGNTGYGVYGYNLSTGTAYGVAGAMTGSGNTGYAGYFTNSDTSNASYGVYGASASSSGYGGYFTNTGAGFALAATGTSYFNGNVGIGTAAPNYNLTVSASATSTTYPANIGFANTTGVLHLNFFWILPTACKPQTVTGLSCSATGEWRFMAIGKVQGALLFLPGQPLMRLFLSMEARIPGIFST